MTKPSPDEHAMLRAALLVAAAAASALAAQFTLGINGGAYEIYLGDSVLFEWDLQGPSTEDLRSLFQGGASVQPAINGSCFGPPLAPWTIINGTASGEIALPLVFVGTATVQFFFINETLAAPVLGQPQPDSIALAASQPATFSVVPLSGSRLRTSSSGPQVGMYWEPWFTPLNFGGWPVAEAIPVTGTYESSQPLMARVHALWMMRAGVHAVGIDWTNNLWSKTDWSQRDPNVQELINDTQLAMGVWGGMRATEGLAAPGAVLLLGLDNGPVASVNAINGELDFMRDALLTNVSVGASGFLADPTTGQPVVAIFDGTGADHSTFQRAPWSIRWMASQLQNDPQWASQLGYWTWMDGVAAPIITPRHSDPSRAEAATAASAYFAGGGWLGSDAAGKRGGATLFNTFSSILARAGRDSSGTAAAIDFLWVNQWNEYAGQGNGQGYGPNKNIYVDIYSSELGNDMEPTDLRACGYARPGVACGGYGWRQYNLLRFLTAWTMDASVAANENVIFITSPPAGFAINGSSNWTVSTEWIRFDAKGVPTTPTSVPTPAGAMIFMVDDETLQATPSGPGQVTLPVPTICQLDPHASFVLQAIMLDESIASYWPLQLLTDDNMQSGSPAVVEVDHFVTC